MHFGLGWVRYTVTNGDSLSDNRAYATRLCRATGAGYQLDLQLR